MANKAKLIAVDEDRWQLMRVRASLLKMSPSQFVEDAIAAHLVATEDTGRTALAEQDLHNATYVTTNVSNYATTPTSGSGSTTMVVSTSAIAPDLNRALRSAKPLVNNLNAAIAKKRKR